jgi:hypothetical protein
MIRKRVADKAKSKSMIDAASLEMNFIKTLKVSTESGATIIRGIYENFRMLGDALLLMRGKEATGFDHHNEMINELFTLNIQTKRPMNVLNSLKSLRNKINYRGYIPSIEETKDSLSIADACFEPILIQVRKELEKT